MREKGRRGRVETCSKYCCKILEIINKNKCPNFLKYSFNGPKYIPYYNRKAYFDNIKLVVKFIKQLSFCSIITSENYEGGFKACTDNVDPGVGPKFDNTKCVIKVIKQLTFYSGITSTNFEGGGARLALTMLTQGVGTKSGKT